MCVCVCVVLVSCSDLLEFLDLCLVKHGKDVGGGSLATLLWVLLPGCSGSTLEGGREGRREEERIFHTFQNASTLRGLAV